MTEDHSAVAAIVVNWNGGEELADCVESLVRGSRPPAEVIIVDNGSTDGSTEHVAKAFRVAVVRPGANRGFAGGCNAGAAAANAPFVLFVNPDVTFAEDAVALLSAALERDPTLAVVGPTVLNRDGSIQSCGLVVDATGHPGGALEPREIFFVSGCALMIRREVFGELGGFDDAYFMFAEDLDLCWRAQLLGHDVRVEPKATVVHGGGGAHPGGYITAEGVTTDAVRMYLRERNTLAAVITNYAPPRAVTIALARLTLGAAEALVFALRGNFDAAAAYPRAAAWNARRYRSLLCKRRDVQGARVIGDDQLRGVVRGLQKVKLVRALGLPRIARPRTR